MTLLPCDLLFPENKSPSFCPIIRMSFYWWLSNTLIFTLPKILHQIQFRIQFTFFCGWLCQSPVIKALCKLLSLLFKNVIDSSTLGELWQLPPAGDLHLIFQLAGQSFLCVWPEMVELTANSPPPSPSTGEPLICFCPACNVKKALTPTRVNKIQGKIWKILFVHYAFV